jgi:hypothetical protein
MVAGYQLVNTALLPTARKIPRRIVVNLYFLVEV